MDSLGQDRMQSLKTNYRRNRTALIILSVITFVLMCYAGLMTLKIHNIIDEVTAENTPSILEAEAERKISEDALSDMQAQVDEAKVRNAAIQAEIDALISEDSQEDMQ